jgi:hypothetical protein
MSRARGAPRRGRPRAAAQALRCALPKQRLTVFAHQLALDHATAEIVAALDAHGIRSILLKGPVLARWLYPDPTDRDYNDIDLLVDPATFSAAEGVLIDLGYVLKATNVHAHDYERKGARPARCDLHRTICWPPVGPGLVWELLSRDCEGMAVAEGRAEILAPAARAFMLALHAAQHGSGTPKPVEDLRRAVELLDVPIWGQAASLAERLSAGPPFARGLLLVESGDEIVRRLELSADGPVELHLRATTASAAAWGLHRVMAAGTARERIRLVAQTLVPPRAFMRTHQRLARRGPLGLAVAYAWRPLRLLARAPRGVLALQIARRQARGIVGCATSQPAPRQRDRRRVRHAGRRARS